MRTHAASPIAVPIGSDRVRIFISGRDERSRARIGVLELSLSSPHEVDVSLEPIAGLGPPGTFDENGMVGACIVVDGERQFIFYSGFQLGVTVPFWFFGGSLLSDDGGSSWRRVSNVPGLDRTEFDPIVAGAPWIIREGGRWRMWYTSGTRWENTLHGLRHYYHIKYAESNDGVHWARQGRVAIDFHGAEHAIGRPCVIRDADRYRMWYSYRGSSYRIGYAESDDGDLWTRRDDLAGIDVSADGWDCEMIEYAVVFDHAGSRWMLYNGNGYGKSGLGLALWTATRERNGNLPSQV